jgi:uncharacterized protein (TIGR03118 family)
VRPLRNGEESASKSRAQPGVTVAQGRLAAQVQSRLPLSNSAPKTSEEVVMRSFTLLLLFSATAYGREPTFREIDLVSDLPGRAQHLDTNLVNPWGLVASPTGPWWVANNGSSESTLYDQNGSMGSLVVSMENASPPTGIVFHSGDGFIVDDHQGNSGAALFMFATEDGFIQGWNPSVPPPPASKEAFVLINNSRKGCRSSTEQNCGSVYKGLAIATDEEGETHIYATDFRNGRVDSFDQDLSADHFRFCDDDIPDGFAPFGIAALKGHLFVTYAKQDKFKHDDVAGRGNGFVDEFDLHGHLIRRVISRGVLNSPWGLAFAPDQWGQYSDDLLVGNFGDGHINVFESRHSGKFHFVDALEDEHDRPIEIDGLWSIVFGTGDSITGPRNVLFFTAGIEDEAHGLFGKILQVQ